MKRYANIVTVACDDELAGVALSLQEQDRSLRNARAKLFKNTKEYMQLVKARLGDDVAPTNENIAKLSKENNAVRIRSMELHTLNQEVARQETERARILKHESDVKQTKTRIIKVAGQKGKFDNVLANFLKVLNKQSLESGQEDTSDLLAKEKMEFDKNIAMNEENEIKHQSEMEEMQRVTERQREKMQQSANKSSTSINFAALFKTDAEMQALQSAYQPPRSMDDMYDIDDDDTEMDLMVAENS
jgi:hypothetical protein